MCINQSTTSRIMSDYEYGITQAVAEKENAIFSGRSIFTTDDVSGRMNKTWVLGSFMIGTLNSDTLEKVDVLNRTFTSAQLTFVDSSPGGSYEINPRPQFTRYADPRVKGQVPGRADTSVMHGENGISSGVSLGAGRYWYESQQEPGQFIHMRFGVPEFNSLTQFFTSFYNEDAARVARTGRSSSVFYSAGNFAGTVVQVLNWPLLAAHVLFAGLRFLLKKPSSKFYYLRPTMPTYWYGVTTMVNQIGTNKGMFPWLMSEGENEEPNQILKVDPAAAEAISEGMPEIFSPSGGIDVYKLGTKAQRTKRAMDEAFYQNLKNATSEQELVNGMAKQTAEAVQPKFGIFDKASHGVQNLMEAWTNTEVGKLLADKEATNVELSLREGQDGKPPELPTFMEYLKAEYDDGGAFVTFRVDYTGQVQESFSNSVVDSDLASKFNSESAKNKSAYFTFAGGNVSEVVGSLIGAAADFAKGVLNSFGASGLVSLAGSAFVDIPKHWENSTTNMPRTTYTTTLISPYGNVLSQMINIYIPLCCLLTAALPKSTGKQSYSWPYLVEYYDKGRAQSRLAMIDSLSVTRGTSNLGFNKAGQAMAVEVSWSMVELSNVLSMPVKAGFSLNPTEGVFDDDNLYSDYMNILASLSLNQQIYSSNRLKLRVAERMRRYQYMISKQSIAGMLHSWPIVGDLDVLFRGVER